jgi:hypothetical protein
MFLSLLQNDKQCEIRDRKIVNHCDLIKIKNVKPKNHINILPPDFHHCYTNCKSQDVSKGK